MKCFGGGAKEQRLQEQVNWLEHMLAQEQRSKKSVLMQLQDERAKCAVLEQEILHAAQAAQEMGESLCLFFNPCFQQQHSQQQLQLHHSILQQQAPDQSEELDTALHDQANNKQKDSAAVNSSIEQLHSPSEIIHSPSRSKGSPFRGSPTLRGSPSRRLARSSPGRTSRRSLGSNGSPSKALTSTQPASALALLGAEEELLNPDAGTHQVPAHALYGSSLTHHQFRDQSSSHLAGVAAASDVPCRQTPSEQEQQQQQRQRPASAAAPERPPAPQAVKSAPVVAGKSPFSAAAAAAAAVQQSLHAATAAIAAAEAVWGAGGAKTTAYHDASSVACPSEGLESFGSLVMSDDSDGLEQACQDGDVMSIYMASAEAGHVMAVCSAVPAEAAGTGAAAAEAMCNVQQQQDASPPSGAAAGHVDSSSDKLTIASGGNNSTHLLPTAGPDSAGQAAASSFGTEDQQLSACNSRSSMGHGKASNRKEWQMPSSNIEAAVPPPAAPADSAAGLTAISALLPDDISSSSSRGQQQQLHRACSVPAQLSDMRSKAELQTLHCKSEPQHCQNQMQLVPAAHICSHVPRQVVHSIPAQPDQSHSKPQLHGIASQAYSTCQTGGVSHGSSMPQQPGATVVLPSRASAHSSSGGSSSCCQPSLAAARSNTQQQQFMSSYPARLLQRRKAPPSNISSSSMSSQARHAAANSSSVCTTGLSCGPYAGSVTGRAAAAAAGRHQQQIQAAYHHPLGRQSHWAQQHCEAARQQHGSRCSAFAGGPCEQHPRGALLPVAVRAAAPRMVSSSAAAAAAGANAPMSCLSPLHWHQANLGSSRAGFRQSVMLSACSDPSSVLKQQQAFEQPDRHKAARSLGHHKAAAAPSSRFNTRGGVAKPHRRWWL